MGNPEASSTVIIVSVDELYGWTNLVDAGRYILSKSSLISISAS